MATIMAPALAIALLALGPAFTGKAAAEEWSRARIGQLPDSAFAVVEIASDGSKVRHLPHHDESGAVDLPHLRAARSRLGQAKWVDPASEAVARRHLDDHWRQPEEHWRRPPERRGPAW